MSDSVTEHFRRSMPTEVCHHFSRLLQCRVYYLNADDSVRCAFAYGQPAPHSYDGDLMSALFGGEMVCGRPVIKEARPGEVYIAINLFIGGAFSGRLTAGPILGLSNAFSGCGREEESFENAVSAACVMYYFVYGEWPDEKQLLGLCADGIKSEKKGKHTPASGQTETVRHHSVVYENHIFSQISDGNEKRLLEMMKTPPDGAYGLLDREHPLRNIKNDCICTITLATRAAIAGGLDSETAFSMSDEAIQNLEKLRDIDGINHLTVKTLSSFARKVAEIRQLGYSYRINRCRNYITNHIYEKLTVSNVAEHFGLTPEYLSCQFKKETGTRLVDFINIARAEEARKLLLYSDKSILEIASMLNYHDQSHFTKSFRAVFGITPKALRIETYHIKMETAGGASVT